MEKRISAPFILTLLFFAALTVVLHPKNALTAENKFLAPPPEHLEYFHFGFRESMADSLWLRWIQDNDSCQTYLAPARPLIAVREDADDVLITNPRNKICDQSWGFKMLDAITRLAPKFLMPYIAGAITLSVVVEDYEGATVIFERGLVQYPNDWSLLYRAAYHFLYDRKDLPRAASLLQRSVDNGAPSWINSLASRLYTRVGQVELGLESLMAYRKTLDHPGAIKEVDKRIADLKRQLESANKN